jgi:hypothetical protein
MNATKKLWNFWVICQKLSNISPIQNPHPYSRTSICVQVESYPYSGVVSIAIKTPSISTKDKLGYKFQVPSFKCMWIILQLKNFKAFATNALNL